VCVVERFYERDREQEREGGREDVVMMMDTAGSGKEAKVRSCDDCIVGDKFGTEGDVVVEGNPDPIPGRVNKTAQGNGIRVSKKRC
jgi:hypothetical protein